MGVWYSYYDFDPISLDSFCFLGPLNAMLLRAIGLWRIQIIAAVVTLAGSVSLAFCTEFWHVIVCYGLLQGRLVTGRDVSQFEDKILCCFVYVQMPKVSQPNLEPSFVKKEIFEQV